MMQEELNALETSFRQQGLTWNQTNFAVAAIRNYVEPLRQQLAEANHAHEFMSWQYKDLQKQLVTALEELEAERNSRFEGNRISSQEYNYSQKQNAALKEALIGWRQRAYPGTDQRIVVERDYPTEPKP